jgi:hypothetical protein
MAVIGGICHSALARLSKTNVHLSAEDQKVDYFLLQKKYSKLRIKYIYSSSFYMNTWSYYLPVTITLNIEKLSAK